MAIATARDTRSRRKNAAPAADGEFTVGGQAAFVSEGIGGGSSYPLTRSREKKGHHQWVPGQCDLPALAGLGGVWLSRTSAALLFGVGLGAPHRASTMPQYFAFI
jgi:hypothetical protein